MAFLFRLKLAALEAKKSAILIQRGLTQPLFEARVLRFVQRRHDGLACFLMGSIRLTLVAEVKACPIDDLLALYERLDGRIAPGPQIKHERSGVPANREPLGSRANGYNGADSVQIGLDPGRLHKERAEPLIVYMSKLTPFDDVVSVVNILGC